MSIVESLEKRRSYYNINKTLPISKEEVIDTIIKVTELVPDAFNCHSARVVIIMDEKQDQLWEAIYEVFGGKMTREKMESFKAGAGTILYFYDQSIIASLQEKFPNYKDNFPLWARDANGMLQISIWSALRDLDIGASLQHYNPVIDELIRDFCDVPDNYKLVAQMPFGGIKGCAPREKEKEDISLRVKVVD